MPTTPLPDASQRICFETQLATAGVSPDGFSDISLITAEAEALGHGIWVDRKGVEQLAAMLVGKSLPSYVTHEGALYSDRLGKEIGLFSGISFDTEAGKLRGNFKFFDSFKKHEAASYERLTELAETMPEQFGISIVFSGSAVWVMEDGSERPALTTEPPEGALRKLPTVRFHSIESADFVKSPAVNAEGLFEKKPAPVDAAGEGMENTTTFSQADVDALIAEKLDEQAETYAAERTELEDGHATALAAIAEEHQVALSERDEKIDALEGELAEARAASADMLGTPPVEKIDAGEDEIELPEPAATDNERWNQYSGLAETDPEKAAAFKAKYLA